MDILNILTTIVVRFMPEAAKARLVSGEHKA
jgi:hypothetical protein